MLAEFVNIDHKDKQLLDLCTGNAPIPLIMSSRINEVVGIEIQKEIYELATESVQLNSIKNVKLINDDIKNIENYFPGNNFDIITCNPPYFKFTGKSIVNSEEIKTIARHEVKINLEEIIKIAYNNLRNRGKLYLVHRTDRMMEILDLFNKYGFGVKKLQMAHYNSDSECSMILLEAKKNSKHDVKIMKPIFTENYGR